MPSCLTIQARLAALAGRGRRFRAALSSHGLLLAVSIMAVGPLPLWAQPGGPDVSRQFLDRLEERQMPDVLLWALDRIDRDPSTAPELKREIPFRRAVALVATSRSESDLKKRAATYDSAP
jgi:hypothetical protein